MATSESELPIREAAGIFFNADHLREAINDLLIAGFEPEELRLLASGQVVERSRGDLYARTNENVDSPQSPAIAEGGRRPHIVVRAHGRFRR